MMPITAAGLLGRPAAHVARSGVPAVVVRSASLRPDRRDHLVRRPVADAGRGEDAAGRTPRNHGNHDWLSRRDRRVGGRVRGRAGDSVHSTARVPTIIAANAPSVTRAPPYLSASQPPNGRVSEPTSGTEERVVGEVDAGAERRRVGHPEVELDQQRHRGGVADERAEGADVEERHHPGVRACGPPAAARAALDFAPVRLSMKRYAATAARRSRGRRTRSRPARGGGRPRWP